MSAPRPRRYSFRGLAMLAGVLWVGTPACGAPAAVHGVVKDEAGHPLPNARVRLLDANGNQVAAVTTDAQGAFTLPAEPDGNYLLAASHVGFEPIMRSMTLPNPSAGALSVSLPTTSNEGQETVIKVTQERVTGASITDTGATDYTMSKQDIEHLPSGEDSTMLDVLTQMPGVALDQNQSIHIRDQHEDGQYRLNGILLPLDMYNDPGVVNMFNPRFLEQVDLLVGVVPADGGLTHIGGEIDLTTRDGGQQPGGTASLFFGQRGELNPAVSYGGGDATSNYFFTGQYLQNNMAFSPATPGPDAIHDALSQEQGFGYFNTALGKSTTRLTVIAAATNSINQLPDVPGTTPQYTLGGVPVYQSANINDYLNTQDYLGVVGLNGTVGDNGKWLFAYVDHSQQQNYLPDEAGQLIYSGISSATTTTNHDQTLQGDVTWTLKNHTLGAGFYVGQYDIGTDQSSLVFPIDVNGNQLSNVPVKIVNNFSTADNIDSFFVNDLWKLSSRLKLNMGLQADMASGFIVTDNQLDPTINLIYSPNANGTFHAGYARYADVPGLNAIAPTTPASFNGTSGQQLPGQSNMFVADDQIWDLGWNQFLNPHLSYAVDNFYEVNHHYGDGGQFGSVPIFVSFNYDHGTTWGNELSLKYSNNVQDHPFSGYLNVTYARSVQFGIDAGQYNYSAAQDQLISTIGLPLDHAPALSITSGVAFKAGAYTIDLDYLYSSGLHLYDPERVTAQVNLGISREFEVPRVGRVTDRLTVLNLGDRINEIRPPGAIGVFQQAFGPRFSVFDALTIPIGPHHNSAPGDTSSFRLPRP